jgi:hypothetical protein
MSSNMVRSYHKRMSGIRRARRRACCPGILNETFGKRAPSRDGRSASTPPANRGCPMSSNMVRSYHKRMSPGWAFGECGCPLIRANLVANVAVELSEADPCAQACLRAAGSGARADVLVAQASLMKCSMRDLSTSMGSPKNRIISSRRSRCASAITAWPCAQACLRAAGSGARADVLVAQASLMKLSENVRQAVMDP